MPSSMFNLMKVLMMQAGDGGLPQAGSKPGGYVPPSKRGGAAGEGDSMRRREENSVRVTNLSEDTREDDLRVSEHCHMMHAGGSCCRLWAHC